MKKIVFGVVLVALALTMITACKSRSLVGTGEESSYDASGKATDVTVVSSSIETSKSTRTSTKSVSGGREVVIDAGDIFADPADNTATERQTQTGATTTASSVKPSAASSTKTNNTSVTIVTPSASTTVRTNAYDSVKGWSDLVP